MHVYIEEGQQGVRSLTCGLNRIDQVECEPGDRVHVLSGQVHQGDAAPVTSGRREGDLNVHRQQARVRQQQPRKAAMPLIYT